MPEVGLDGAEVSLKPELESYPFQVNLHGFGIKLKYFKEQKPRIQE